MSKVRTTLSSAAFRRNLSFAAISILIALLLVLVVTSSIKPIPEGFTAVTVEDLNKSPENFCGMKIFVIPSYTIVRGEKLGGGVRNYPILVTDLQGFQIEGYDDGKGDGYEDVLSKTNGLPAIWVCQTHTETNPTTAVVRTYHIETGEYALEHFGN